MAFWNRNERSELPASQVEYQQEPGRNWKSLVIYLLLALLVAAAVVFAGRWVYNTVTDDSPAPAPTAPQDADEPEGTPESTGRNGDSRQPGTTPPATPGSPGATPRPSPTPSNLPDNGPGHVAALFIGTSLAAAGLHYVVTLRRTTR